MEYCTRCGGNLQQGTGFCAKCGAGTGASPPSPDKNTPRSPERSLEESVERIFKDRGYETALHEKIRGRSGSEVEIDVVARRGAILLAIECKNYAADRKVGTGEVGDFISKLDELDISRGLLVTTSDFSPDAVRLADNNPSSREIDLWNGAEFLEQYQKAIRGRADANLPVIEDCLQPTGTAADYAALKLKNGDRVTTGRCGLVFHPYFIVEFDLHEKLFTPGQKAHIVKNSGIYFIDGVSEEVLFRKSENGNATYDINPTEKQVVRDLMALRPTPVRLPGIPGASVSKLEPAMSNRDVEFRIKTLIVSENKTSLKGGRGGSHKAGADDAHSPHINSVDARSRMVYVPIMEIEFESGGRIYSRTVLPASGVVTRDDIAFCPKPGPKKRETVAVCDVCGIAECEDDIISDGRGAYYCRDHFPAEQGKAEKGKSISDKFRALRFGK